MKYIFKIIIFFSCSFVFSQSDFSNSWEDFFSYNNAKDFVKVDNKLYVAVDNAIFIYNETDNTTVKYSSINGLSGKTVTTVNFDKISGNLIIGYDSGLIEIIDKNGKIHISSDIERLNITGNKQINHIFNNNGILYLSTPFGIVVYNTNLLQFGDTFFIGALTIGFLQQKTTSYLVLAQTIWFQKKQRQLKYWDLKFLVII